MLYDFAPKLNSHRRSSGSRLYYMLRKADQGDILFALASANASRQRPFLSQGLPSKAVSPQQDVAKGVEMQHKMLVR